MRTLIENCFALRTSLIKKDLRKTRENKPVEGGFLNFIDNGRASVLDYSIERDHEDRVYLVVNIYSETQRILLSERQLSFGVMQYLTCGCGGRVNALYLKLGYFGCRKCQRLRYRSTTINTTSEHGRFLQLQAQRIKLMALREKIDRPIYKGSYTKRFLHWLGLCSKAGVFDEVVRAWKTMDAIKGINSQ